MSKEYICECGQIFDNSQKFNGHKQGCKVHLLTKYSSLEEYYANKNRNQSVSALHCSETCKRKAQEKLNAWIAEEHHCEHCGKLMKEKYGSGRFCSRACANFRVFTEESNKKKGATSGKKCYSNIDTGESIYLNADDVIPDGFIPLNVKLVNPKHIEVIDSHKVYTGHRASSNHLVKRSVPVRKKRVTQTFLIQHYNSYIQEHNNSILAQYEFLLQQKAKDKTFNVIPDCIIAKYQAVSYSTHPRAFNGKVFVHNLLAEQLLGRYLNDEELVHHINEDKLDNRFDNIYVFDNISSHSRFHMSKHYWLSIKDDVLVCDKIDYTKLKELYDLETA